MIARWVIGLPLVLVLGFGAVNVAQHQLDGRRAHQFDDELLYLPNEQLLTHFTGGMSSVVASFLWLQCIQYTAETFREDRKLEWLAHMSHTITRLDPHFVDVYRYGGVFLASLEADDDASIDLMRRGMRHNPHDWGLPYEIAMVYLLNRRDHPDSARLGVQYMHMAMATGNAPEFLQAAAEGLHLKHDLPELERAMWEDALETAEDDLMRDIARRKLKELDIRELCRELTSVVQAYAKHAGGVPRGLETLVAEGMLAGIPETPLEGEFVIDSKGEVHHTAILDDLLERRLNRLSTSIAQFREEHERPPASLDELLDSGTVSHIPQHPYPDRTWEYDSAEGEVRG